MLLHPSSNTTTPPKVQKKSRLPSHASDLPKTESLIAALVLAIILCLLFWIALSVFQRPPPRPSISTAFLGYTNDARGAPVARLAITNLNSRAVVRVLRELDIPAPANPAGSSTYSRIAGVATIPGRGTEIFTVPFPTNQPQWKLSFLVYPDTIPVRAVKMTAYGIFHALGLKPKYRVTFYYFETGWIHGQTNTQAISNRLP